jgi:hypothetical protein
MGTAGGSTETIEVHVADLAQFLNAMDPSPFPERDLDPRVENYILDWAREAHRHATLELEIHVDRPPANPADSDALRSSLTRYFDERGQSKRHELKRLLKRGRTSLLVGVAFLAAASVTGELLHRLLEPGGHVGIMSEGLLIGGWVAMWRPIEILLYDWWPLRAEYQLFDRLRDMKVHIDFGTASGPLTQGARVVRSRP